MYAKLVNISPHKHAFRWPLNMRNI